MNVDISKGISVSKDHLFGETLSLCVRHNGPEAKGGCTSEYSTHLTMTKAGWQQVINQLQEFLDADDASNQDVPGVDAADSDLDPALVAVDRDPFDAD